MILAPFQAIALALALLVPSAASARAAEDPPDDDEIVIDEDGVFAFDSDDEPLVLRLRSRLGGGYIGVRLLEMTPELRAHYGAPRDAGVLVSEVEADSPAARAGIQVGDIITAAGGERIESPRELSREVRSKKGGETLEVELSRGRSAKRLTVTVEERRRSGRDLSDFRHGKPDRRWMVHDLDSMRPLLDRAEDLARLQERLEEMEKRLKELEKRLGAK